MRIFLLCLFILPLHAQLRIDAQDFKIKEANLRKILQPAIAALPKHPDFDDPPLFVSHDTKGPITLYERTPRGEVAILLDCSGTYYSQYLYQFAHELAHVRTNFQPTKHPHRWLEETLCETASLFILRKLSSEWQTEAPNEILKDYSPHLATYAKRVINTREPLTLKTSAAYYQRHKDKLQETATLRQINGAFAALILPLLEDEPEHWKTLRYFPRLPNSTLAEHFAAWKKKTKPAHHPFLDQLQEIFLQR